MIASAYRLTSPLLSSSSSSRSTSLRQKLSLFSTTTSSSLPTYISSTSGEPHTSSYRLHFHEISNPSKKLSSWHDIPYKPTGTGTGEQQQQGIYHFVNEIPKYSKAKFEIATKEIGNPIAQDMKKGKLRDYHGPIYWNYGAIPQTWENPHVIHNEVKCIGDNDPIDVVEIGSKILHCGSVHRVRKNS